MKPEKRISILGYVKKCLTAIERLYTSSVYLEQKLEVIEKELKQHQVILQQMLKNSNDLKSFEEKVFKQNETEKDRKG